MIESGRAVASQHEGHKVAEHSPTSRSAGRPDRGWSNPPPVMGLAQAERRPVVARPEPMSTVVVAVPRDSHVMMSTPAVMRRAVVESDSEPVAVAGLSHLETVAQPVRHRLATPRIEAPLILERGRVEQRTEREAVVAGTAALAHGSPAADRTAVSATQTRREGDLDYPVKPEFGPDTIRPHGLVADSRSSDKDIEPSHGSVGGPRAWANPSEGVLEGSGTDPRTAGGREGVGGSDYGWLKQLLWQEIDRAKQYAEQAVANEWEGRVVLIVGVRTDGGIDDVAVMESSGNRALDRDASEMVRRVARLALDRPLGADRVRLRVPIKFGLE